MKNVILNNIKSKIKTDFSDAAKIPLGSNRRFGRVMKKGITNIKDKMNESPQKRQMKETFKKIKKQGTYSDGVGVGP